MPEIDKHASLAWHTRIRAILNHDWDPIGGCPADEYDAYLGKIAAMLRDNASDQDLVAYFKWAEVDHMGVGSEAQFDSMRILKVIAALREIGPRGSKPL